YVFLGRELGGKPSDPALLKDGRPDYAAMARTPEFVSGLKIVIEASKTDRVALLCAERDPIHCHRFLLIGPELAARNVPVAHLLATGAIESQADAERRASGEAPDLFRR